MYYTGLCYAEVEDKWKNNISLQSLQVIYK